MAPFKCHGKAPEFDLDEYKNTFKVFEMKWKVVLRLSGIDEGVEAGRRDQYKADMLLSGFSPTTLHTVMSMGLTDDEMKNHETIIKKLKERFMAGRNQHVWRHEFNQKKQLLVQGFDDFLCKLRDLAGKCAFDEGCCANCINARLIDRIVVGVESDELRIKLIEQAATLTLDNAITVAQAWEATNKSVSSLRSETQSSIEAIRSRSTYKQNKVQQQHQAVAGPAGGCQYCGGNEDHNRKFSPAANRSCYKCNKSGHFAIVFQSSKQDNQ